MSRQTNLSHGALATINALTSTDLLPKGAGLDDPRVLDALARKTGAFSRSRKILTPLIQLRLALIWAVVDNMSLRSVAGWALMALDVAVSDTALRNRFLKMKNFVLALISLLCEQKRLARSADAVTLRIIDATTLRMPGSVTSDFFWHVEYDPRSAQVTSCSLTDINVPEGVARTDIRRVDVMMGDCLYGKAKHVHEAHRRDVVCLCRVYLPHVRLLNSADERVDLEWLQRQVTLPTQLPVRIFDGKASVQATLLIHPLPKEAAQRARQNLRKKAKRNGKTPSAGALWLAGYWTMISTLNSDLIDAKTAAKLYRVRWQVERFFKRAKSVHGLDKLRKMKPALARVQFALKVLFILVTTGFLKVAWNQRCGEPAISHKNDTMPSSLWRQAALTHQTLISVLWGSPRTLVMTEAVRRQLAERPRLRRYACESLASYDEVLIPQAAATSCIMEAACT